MWRARLTSVGSAHSWKKIVRAKLSPPGRSGEYVSEKGGAMRANSAFTSAGKSCS